MSLPLIPGYSHNYRLGKERFHKSHIFDRLNETKFSFGTHKPGIGGDPLPGGKYVPPISYYPVHNDYGKSPAWIAFDKQVLNFDAYYTESVPESRLEQYRIRQVKIHFHLEDDTIQIIEPRIRNSSLPQGVLLRRHRIPKPVPMDHMYYTVHDFNVGSEVKFYDRTYRIVSCDIFTENFLRKLGVHIGKPEKVPEDQYTNTRKAMEESMQPLRPLDRTDKFRQFLDHDRHVLRFYCFWDDSDNLYGDPREMILNYFLSDDTIEIREIVPKNAGRDGAPTFLRRQKLPKVLEPMPEPGSTTDKILLNVLGHPQRGGRVLIDSLKTGLMKQNFYTDADLTIGSYINVYGRKFVICSIDEFTKEYYRTKYGIKTFNDVRYTMHKGVPIIHKDPPYNGWGSEEDSLGNCRGLVPEPIKGDFIKFLEKDRRGLDSNVLSFNSRMITDKPIDQGRKFILSFFLSDDTILIMEPPVKNSGFIGGKFLERSKVKKPNQERFRVELPKYYLAQDLYVGAEVEANSFKFLLEDADEYTFEYMETHPNEFLFSNINTILNKLRPKTAGKRDEMMSYFTQQDPEVKKSVSFRQLMCLLRQIVNEKELNDHEIITLARHYAVKPIKPLNIELLLGVAQQELRKVNFDDFDGLLNAFITYDKDRYGFLSREEMMQVIKSFRIKLPEDMLQALFDISQNLDNGRICYEQFVHNLNWRINPYEAPCEPDLPVDQAYKWRLEEEKPVGKLVNQIYYEPLVRDLTPEKFGSNSQILCTPVSEDRAY